MRGKRLHDISQRTTIYKCSGGKLKTMRAAGIIMAIPSVETAAAQFAHFAHFAIIVRINAIVMRARAIVLSFCLLVVAQHLAAAANDKQSAQLPADKGPRQSKRLLDLLVGRYRPCLYCSCGKSNRGGARFLGGEYTDTHEFPWLANIHVKNSLLISGTLINDRYVLSAASQLVGATPPEIKVSIGEYDRCHLDVSSANISVDAVISHPEFSYESRAHDLALIRLSRSTQFERRILPVCLPEAGSSYLGQVGTLMGWTERRQATALEGNDTDIETRSCRPRKLGLPILGRRECLLSGIKPESYHEESGCIGIVGSSPIICQNDVGTSLLHRSYSGFYDFVGIMSDMNNCNGTIGTAVYTRIGPHLHWIFQNTKDACYCLKPFDVPEIKSSMYAY